MNHTLPASLRQKIIMIQPVTIKPINLKREFTMIKGTFTSNWSEASISTACTLDPNTGELTTVSAEVSDLGTLENEEFTADNGDTYKVCPVCHEYILKSKVVPDQVGNGLHEEDYCSNPNCEYNDK